MSLKILFLMLLVCALNFNAFSQKSADDAAKTGLNVGAKMPVFSLKDASGKTIESGDLLKQANLVVVFIAARGVRSAIFTCGICRKI